MAVRVTGMDKVARNLARELDQIKANSVSGITKATLYVKAESQKITPHRTGNLMNSAYIRIHQKFRKVVGEVGYNALYAVFVHENPRAGQTGGLSPSGKKYSDKGGIGWARTGQWKFLETPLKNTRLILSIIANSMRIR